MFVQLNPEAASYVESLSTLKFAERVSGVELGPARSSKEGSNIKQLMEQVFYAYVIIKYNSIVLRKCCFPPVFCFLLMLINILLYLINVLVLSGNIILFFLNI